MSLRTTQLYYVVTTNLCIDRTIDVESTGRKNIVTKKEVTVSKVKDEKRKIVFRDDNYSIDSKSRLAAIEPEIPLDANELIRALKDAIKNSKKKSGNSTAAKATTPKPAPDPVIEPEPIEEDDIDDIDTPVEETTDETPETSTYPDDLDAVIRKMYKECKDAKLKAKVKEVISEYGKLNDVDEDGLERIYDMMQE